MIVYYFLSLTSWKKDSKLSLKGSAATLIYYPTTNSTGLSLEFSICYDKNANDGGSSNNLNFSILFLYFIFVIHLLF